MKPGLPEKTHWDGLTVPMLRMELERRGLSIKGSKTKLIDTLNSCEEEARPDSFPDLKPGTEAITNVASARVSLPAVLTYCSFQIWPVQ